MVAARKAKQFTDAEAALWKAYHADRTIATRNALVEWYLPLVRYHANRILARLPDGAELDDLVSAGTLGLMDAIKVFDRKRKVPFVAYSAPRIRGAMLDELRKLDWVPRLVRAQASQIDRAAKTLCSQLGRIPTVGELARHCGFTVDLIEKTLAQANAIGTVSLDREVFRHGSNGPDGELGYHQYLRIIDYLKDRLAPDPTRHQARLDLLHRVTRGLTTHERMVVIMYYYEGMTMQTIGEQLDLSEGRISQLHSRIIRRLKAVMVQADFADTTNGWGVRPRRKLTADKPPRPDKEVSRGTDSP
jgi:RNA polymerase sigma factor FliA